MNIDFSSDQPIQEEKQDRFQRYNFAKRIATTIIEKENTDCIVIGLYGAWGEGKTSVLNFINSELVKVENAIILNFNPWRFKDEEALLNDFFNLLAKKLNTPLKTKGQMVVELVRKYGKLTAPMAKFIPIAGEAIASTFEQIGDAFPNETLEDVKAKINAILKQSKKKIVVFIDDIDRLEKTEIHSIFRLVKLTADFYNTTYLLSFDEQMVASAIGERFGEGNKEAGKKFLEKIIQVPLNLPLAQPEALQQFYFDIINDVFKANKIEIFENEGKRFSNQFQSKILLRLKTPRLAIRYGNTFSFSLPLLHKEVNIDDLMLMEAIKIFYPEHYEFIRLNPEFFIGSYKEPFGNAKDDKKINLLNSHFEKLGMQLNAKEKECIEELLVNLFPRLTEVYHNYSYTDAIEINLYKNMQVGSPKHFNRFFSYAVIKGDLSDIAFKNFINNISTQSIEEVANSIKDLVQQSSPENFLIKIRSLEDEYDWNISRKVAKGISSISDIFPKTDGYSLIRYQTPNGQAQIFISQLIKKHNSEQERLELAKELMNEAKYFNFAYDLYSWLGSEDKTRPQTFSEEQFLEIDNVLLRRAIYEAAEISIFEKFPIEVGYLVNSWEKIDKNELSKYTKNFLAKNPKEIINLLNVYTPTIYSSLYPKPYKANFTKKDYEHLISIFDKNYINDMILKYYDLIEINAEEVKWIDRDKDNQTDLNIVRQFLHWMNE